MCAGLLVLSAGVKAGQSPGRYTDPEYHYSFAIPAGWIQKQDQPRPLVAFLGPVEQGFRVNVTIYSESVGGASLQQYTKVSKSNIAKEPGWHLNSERKTTLGGTPAVLLQSALTIKGQPPVENRQVLCLHNKRGFVITLTTLPSNMKTYAPVFQKMLTSFRW